MQRNTVTILGRRTVLFALCASMGLTACGSSESSDSDTSEAVENSAGDAMDESDDQSMDSLDEYNGTGTISIDGNTHTFGLKCSFGEETMSESVSIGIVGENDTVGMSFSQMYGFDFNTGQFSPDVPEDHSISIYEMPSILLRYEYLSLTSKELLDVSGKTVSGTATFAIADSEGETFGQPTTEGDVELICD